MLVNAGVAQLVEHHVANVVVEGSSPFTRFFLLAVGRVGQRQAFAVAAGSWAREPFVQR